MRSTVLVFALWPTLAPADDWKVLDGGAIAAALTARVLAFGDGQAADGALQDFFADGRTLYGDQWGRWEVRGDRYCSTWPPSDRWTCHYVARQGLDIRFTSELGEVTIGRYVDLN